MCLQGCKNTGLWRGISCWLLVDSRVLNIQLKVSHYTSSNSILTERWLLMAFLYVCYMTIHEAGQQLRFQLFHLYDEREAASIMDMVMEHITGWKKIDRIVNKTVPLSAVQSKT